MMKLLLSAALLASTTSVVAVAAPKTRHKTTRVNLAGMNLTPNKAVVRPISAREFTQDATPTSFHYTLRNSGMGAVVGYKPFVDDHRIPGYEVNQATALGFNQPSSSVGAGLAYKF